MNIGIQIMQSLNKKMTEVQKILDFSFPFVESLLINYGEFYPLASAVNTKGEVEQIVREEDPDNDFPKSNTVIGELKKELRWNREQFLAVAIFYDVTIKEMQTDAIAVYVEDKKEKQAFTFFYAYKMIDNKPEFTESWKQSREVEIFID